MQITANDVDRIEDSGTIDGNPVKLVRTKGGFWLALGRRKYKSSEDVLAAGSHPAIVKYQLEKQFPDYHPAMMKSEGFVEPLVMSHSHFLSDDLRKNGYDIFSVQTGPSVEFLITKHNSQIATVNSEFSKDHLIIENLNIPKEFAKAMAGATVEKSVSCEAGLKLKK